MPRRPGKRAGILQLPEDLESYLDAPFGGLFGSSALAKVVEALIADPHAAYRREDLEEIADTSRPALREALRTLARLGLVVKGHDDWGDPVYMVDRTSSLFVALVLLSYALVDDREGTDTMAAAIRVFGASAEGTRKRTRTKTAPAAG